MIVVDANVAAKWYLPEVGSDAALALMDGPSLLFAPDLIRLDVLSAITRRVRTGEATAEISAARCRDWLRHLRAGAVSVLPEQELLEEAVRLSMEIRHTLQDCLYLAAAHKLDASLITADKPFQERANRLYSRVVLLAGCEQN